LVFSLLAGGTAASAQPASLEKTNAAEISDVQALLRSNLIVQEQLHNALRAIEQARQDADSAARKNADVFNERLSAMEKNLAEQRQNDLESMRNSNRFVLTAASILGGIGILALLCTAWFQVRALHRIAEVGAFMSASIPGDSTRALLEGNSHPARLGTAEQANARFLATIEQLEKKIQALESNSHSAVQTAAPKIILPGKAENGSNGSRNPENSARVSLLLTEGQTLLDSGDKENALVYFEQAIDLEPNNTEALIKKGTTLEALRKMHEAIETYDRVIALDSSMTVAYLYKGGVLNRLQRFSEAMECYEQALRTHPKSAA
jgi:tetratricopeptide (TPR) repeat protein